MSDPVIRVENLSKRYMLGYQTGRGDGLRHVLQQAVSTPWRALKEKLKAEKLENENDSISDSQLSAFQLLPVTASQLSPVSASSEDFWALKDVSFEVKRGEVVGIIGRNGAGKSTLLKILSRITEPTSGRIEIDGRVASLLEVGTGFHPELTGRENIFLNGAILGMSRAEIRMKFDEIVAFAEIEKFLDTPVKRYSSGMYVRLAFAVAAHLEPEILIVDEVLAVGDTEFQKKCLGKMQDVAGHGRTVLFVSHNTTAIATLTNKCIYLRNGMVATTGATSDVLRGYLTSENNKETSYRNDVPNGQCGIRSVRIVKSIESEPHVSGKDLEVEFEIVHPSPIKGACLSFQVVNQFQQPVLHCWIYDCDQPICRSVGQSLLSCCIPTARLNVGNYSLTVYFSEPPGGTQLDKLEGICPFEVVVTERQTLFGWRPDACTYLPLFLWQTKTNPEK